MLKRLRRMEISLAAKCQLLFGAAVIVTLSAALFVPWQRMEQLTEQLNEKAASVVAQTTVAEHVLRAKRGVETPTPPATTTRPAVAFDGQIILPPRLIGVDLAKTPERLTRFENAALQRFMKDRKLGYFARFYDTHDSADGGYRYARPLVASGECVNCHGKAAPTSSPLTIDLIGSEGEEPPISEEHPTLAPSTAPATQPALLLGMVSVDIPSQISARQQLLNHVFILTAGLIAGTVAIAVFYVVTTRVILQPVRVLQETAEKVSEGDLNIRSDINTGDEFQVLSETFNTMLVNLKSSADQLRAVNKSLDLRLGQLAESNVALYESNRLKSEFLANVSHELRTPLNSILGFAELLRELTGSATEPKVFRYIQNILLAGHNLLDLINDLLDLAKIEAGRMEVRSEPLSLKDLFEALTGLLKPLTEAKQLTVATSTAPDVPIIETDPAKLQQILYNLLSNAIKFSPAGARIELRASAANERVQISVTDQGPGIEPEKHGVIFEKFRQIDGSVTRQHSGTGLGLAISKELASLLQGTLTVQSEMGQGATFTLALPPRIDAANADLRGKMSLI